MLADRRRFEADGARRGRAQTTALGASSFLLGAPGFKPPCLLRIGGGSTTFDPNWQQPFSAWSGDATAAELVPVTEALAYTRVYDPTLGPEQPQLYWDFASADAWR